LETLLKNFFLETQLYLQEQILP